MKATPWIRPLGLLTIGLFWVTGCASVDLQSQLHPRQSPSQFSTYAWDTRDSAKGSAAAEFGPLQNTLTNTVNRLLRQKGYTQATGPRADLQLHYSINVVIEETRTPSAIVDSDRPGSSLLTFGGNGGLALEPHAETADRQETETATLVISLNRQGMKDPLWVGTAHGDLLKALPMDVRKKRLRTILTKLFSGLPARR